MRMRDLVIRKCRKLAVEKSVDLLMTSLWGAAMGVNRIYSSDELWRLLKVEACWKNNDLKFLAAVGNG